MRTRTTVQHAPEKRWDIKESPTQHDASAALKEVEAIVTAATKTMAHAAATRRPEDAPFVQLGALKHAITAITIVLDKARAPRSTGPRKHIGALGAHYYD